MSISLDAYIFFKGNCREAMEFYESVFGGDLNLMTLGDMPADMQTDEYKDRKDEIMNAVLKTDHFTLRASDSKAASPETKKVELCLTGDDEATMRQWFDGLGQDDSVKMKLQKMFWGDIFGTITDKFGVDWMMNITQPK